MTNSILKLSISASLLFTELLPAFTTEESVPVHILERTSYEFTDFPDLSSQYVFLQDMDSGQILYQKNATEQMYPASMTKLMSALLVLQNETDLERTITVTSQMLSGLSQANASVAGFKSGDQVRIVDLLYGVLLPSGADAVQILAIDLCGSIDSFVEWMNRTAQEIGMYHTHFTNPTGLFDASHVSTAEDIALLLKTCLSTPGFERFLDAEQWTTAPIASAPDGLRLNSTFRPLINHGEGSFTIPGFLGGKSGYTTTAGRCLASHAQIQDMHLILITGLSSGSGHVADASAAYTYCSNMERTSLVHSDQILGSVKILDAQKDLTLSFYAEDEFSLDLPNDAVIETVIDLPKQIEAPLQMGQKLGTMTITIDGQTLLQAEMCAPADISYSPLHHMCRMVSTLVHAHPILSILALLMGLLILRMIKVAIARKVRRRKKRRS